MRTFLQSKINDDMYVSATAGWRSTFKFQLLTNTKVPLTFNLAWLSLHHIAGSRSINA